MTMKKCIDCNRILEVNKNWRASSAKSYLNVCDRCTTKRCREWSKTSTGKKSIRQSQFINSRTTKKRFKNAIRNSQKREIDWKIPFQKFEYLLSLPCLYCGGATGETGSGLDRVDNNMGYILKNVVPCCGTCNKLKGPHLTTSETKLILAIRNKQTPTLAESLLKMIG